MAARYRYLAARGGEAGTSGVVASPMAPEISPGIVTEKGGRKNGGRTGSTEGRMRRQASVAEVGAHAPSQVAPLPSGWGRPWTWLREWWNPEPPRQRLLREARAMAMGVAATDRAHTWIGADAAAEAASLRATRAVRTSDQASSATRRFIAFLEANPTLAASGRWDAEVWDVAAEAFVTALSGEGTTSWRLPSGSGPIETSAAGTLVSRVSALATRMGYAPIPWHRLKLAKESLGCNDAEDNTVPTEPIFTWEVAEVGRLAVPSDAWQSCAWAMVTLGCIGGPRVGSVQRLLLREVQWPRDEPNVVIITPRARQKQQRQRVSRRSPKRPRPMALEHWLVGRFVRPWCEWHIRNGSNGSSLFFPSLVRADLAQVRSVVGRLVDGGKLRLEPTKRWAHDAVRRALDLCLLDRRGRRFHGLRGGNNRELRRHREEVSDVTRRTLHGRTVHDLIGSESSYQEVFFEDFCSATRLLGQMRITQYAKLLTVSAFSPSAGLLRDWVPRSLSWSVLEGAVDESTDESDGPVSSDRESRDCGGCRGHISRRAHASLCDTAGCGWGLCMSCWSEPASVPLACPKHKLLRKRPL